MASTADSGPDYGLALVASPAEVKKEVIFVHGLNGHRSRTWTNSNGDFWPAWLSELATTSRVWTYGYNSGIWKTPSEDALELHCVKLLDACVEGRIGSSGAPIVFVCHSLGGILVKAAIVDIWASPPTSRWASLRARLNSVIFLGTPHRGSEWANRLYVLLLGPSIFWPGSSFVPLLRKGNVSLLARIAEQFNNRWGDRAVLSFRETKGIAPLGRIVKPNDARTYCSGETVLDVPFDHRRLARVMSRDETVVQEITRHLNQLVDAVVDGAPPDVGGPDSTSRVGPSSSVVLDPTPSVQSSWAEESEFSWGMLALRSFYRGLQHDQAKQRCSWEALTENFRSQMPADATTEQRSKFFQSGTFLLTYPHHETTQIILRVPGTQGDWQADWTVIAPNSLFHPGRHDGRLLIRQDFPFKPPVIQWDSPIISAYVNSAGRVCQPDDYWSPQYSSLAQHLIIIAAIVIFGPELSVSLDESLKQLPHRPEQLGRFWFIQKGFFEDGDDDWMRRVSNLVSRAYNRLEDDDDLNMFDNGDDTSRDSVRITDADRQTTVLAIQDFCTHVWPAAGGRGNLLDRLAQQGKRGLERSFQEVSTLRSLLLLERSWVDAINEIFGWPLALGWGRAETCAEHQRRIQTETRPRG